MVATPVIIVVFIVLVAGVAAAVAGSALGSGTDDDPVPPEAGALLSIHVQDEDGGPLSGATITMDGVARGETGAAGDWAAATHEGARQLRVAASGFQPVAQSLTMADTAASVTVTLPGWSGSRPWPAIAAAVQSILATPAPTAGQGTAVTPPTVQVALTYSFVPSGVPVGDGGETAVAFADYHDGSVPPAQFVSQIEEAFAQWKALFEDVYSVARGYHANLEITFTRTIETGDPPPLLLNTEYRASFAGDADTPAFAGIGHFRFGMFTFDPTLANVLAYAYFPPAPGHVTLGFQGDVLFNASVDWRMDDDVSDGGSLNITPDGGFSVLYVTVHELGHALGHGHHQLTSSVMAPSQSLNHSLSTHLGAGGLRSSIYMQTAVAGIYGSA